MMNKIFSFTKVLMLALALSFGLSYALAWTAPTQQPPAGNISAPINTSATAQIKAGGLTVGNLCLSGVCNSSWPTGATISGSGTTGNVVKWVNSNTLGNSQIIDNGTNVGIGTANPLSTLSVGGGGASGTGIYGYGSTYGIFGSGPTGVYGSGSGYGVYGSGSYTGVFGIGSSIGVYGSGSNFGVYSYGSNIGGKFETGPNGYNIQIPARNDNAHGASFYSINTGQSSACPSPDLRIAFKYTMISLNYYQYILLCSHMY